MITLTINGKECKLEKSICITELLESYKLIAAMVVIERNAIIVDKEKYNSEFLAENDNIEIIKFAGGG